MLSIQIESFDISFAICLAMSFLSATFAILAIKERVSKAKHLQVRMHLFTRL